MGITNTGLAYLLYFSGLQKAPGQSVALISYIDPVSATALLSKYAFLHESMTPVQIWEPCSSWAAPCVGGDPKTGGPGRIGL